MTKEELEEKIKELESERSSVQCLAISVGIAVLCILVLILLR